MTITVRNIEKHLAANGNPAGEYLLRDDGAGDYIATWTYGIAQPDATALAAYDAEIATEDNDADLKRQIRDLEKEITPRRMREAVLGTGGTWLSDKETEIAALRAQLS